MEVLFQTFLLQAIGLISFLFTFNLLYWGSKIFIEKENFKILFLKYFVQ